MRTPAHKFLTLALISTPLFGVACMPTEDEGGVHDSEAAGLGSFNGLSSVNGLSSCNGLGSVNGLYSANGLSSVNGLGSVNGLSSVNGLMTTTSGRTTMTYIAKCALPAGRSISKSYNNVSYNFPGLLGVAPEWESGACNTTCQEQVSACVLAHVNTTGQHISLWMDGDALGWGQNSNYPYQEGSFFGNIFGNSPKAQFCNGKDFDMGLVPGRLGVGSGAPYSNPFSSGSSYCKDHCTAAPGSASGDGYASCNGFKHVVTVWRNFDPNTDYKVCNRYTGKCLDVASHSTAEDAQLIQYRYTGGSNQKWRITQISPKKYKFINVNSGKALDINGGWTGDGAQLIQHTYNGGANQMWSFTPTGDGFYKFSPGSNPNGSLDVKDWSTADGAIVQQWTWTGGINKQWSIVPAN